MLHTVCDIYLASGSVKHFVYKNSCCEFLVNASTSDVCNQQAGAGCRAGAGPTDGDSNARLSNEPFYPAENWVHRTRFRILSVPLIGTIKAITVSSYQKSRQTSTLVIPNYNMEWWILCSRICR